MPTFTIITVSFNEINSIEKTINSILLQTFTDFDIVVVDGGSNDGTAEYLSSISQKFSYYISEKDSGIYDAMNKAIKWARGDFLYFLNAGDYFFNNTVLQDTYDFFKKNSLADVLYGKVAYKVNEKLINEPPDEHFQFNSINDFYEKNLQQQCFFYRNYLFKKENHFNTKNRICSDYEFNVDLIKKKFNFVFIPLFFCVFESNGISSTNTATRLKEKRKIIIKHSSIIEIMIYINRGFIQFLKRNFL